MGYPCRWQAGTVDEHAVRSGDPRVVVQALRGTSSHRAVGWCAALRDRSSLRDRRTVRAELITRGPEFRRIRELLFAKYPPYEKETIPEGESVMVRVIPEHKMSWGLD